ncbi:hypothetical protein PGIGA_G00190930 [Pangasianodon gigas]|uniref:Uncharacterized protein n=1 Tax=Pangasianodon gigas TaxID=30993 RepID=A0ACC5WC46_PANGG|nr:hypothetical protein [Pangasianodon gigas]
MPGDYLPRSSPMTMGMCQPAYGGPQLPHQLRPGPPMCSYIPGHPQHSVMLMHGGPAHPAMPMSASSPSMFPQETPPWADKSWTSTPSSYKKLLQKMDPRKQL